MDECRDVLARQESPYPMPGRQNSGPIRSSIPTPPSTVPTSAPTASHTAAISLAKLIRIARNALLAYLIVSASTGVVRT